MLSQKMQPHFVVDEQTDIVWSLVRIFAATSKKNVIQRILKLL